MATQEKDTALTMVDEFGNTVFLYPATRGNNVIGAVEDSEALGGVPASEYAKPADIPRTDQTVTPGSANPTSSKAVIAYVDSQIGAALGGSY